MPEPEYYLPAFFRMNSQKVHFEVAGFGIVVFAERGYSIEVEPGWKNFTADRGQPVDVAEDGGLVEIFARAGIPDHLTDQCNPVFEAGNESQRFFSVFRHGESLRFLIYSQPEEGVMPAEGSKFAGASIPVEPGKPIEGGKSASETIQQVAVVGKDFSRWEVYSEPAGLPGKGGTLLPLRYPLGPLIMYYLTVGNEAIMIHASGVHDGRRGRLFTGFSGFGKSTISRIWREAGSILINDDRLIIRKQGEKFLMYNTPMFYEDVPRSATLDEIFLIRHAPANTVERISGATAVTRVLAHCIQNNYDKRYIENHLAFLGDLCSKTGIFDLGFVPDAGVVDFVRGATTDIE